MATMTASQFVTEVENQLGWVPRVSAQVPLWKARSVEIAKLNKAMVKHQVSFADLQLALAWSRQRREPVESPAALVLRVQAAREVAVNDQVNDVDEAAQEAISWEMDHNLSDSDRWIFRLVRTTGPARVQTLAEWAAARDERLNFG